MAARTYGHWIEWNGRTKRCPLPDGTHHQVKFRNGQIATDDRPENWVWKHDGGSADIVAYRIERHR